MKEYIIISNEGKHLFKVSATNKANAIREAKKLNEDLRNCKIITNI